MLEELSKYTYIDFKKIKLGDLIDKSNASVYKGIYDNKTVALKAYEYDDEDEDDFVDLNIYIELYIGKQVSSERLMKVYGYTYDYDEKIIYVVLEYINSDNLWDYIKKENFHIYIHSDTDKYPYYTKQRRDCWGYTMTRKTKYSIGLSLLKAIRSLWREGIVHGDLKPENLVIERKDDGQIYLKVIDYGTCIQDDYMQLNYCCGTDGFVSPELDKDFILSHKSDIYAVGAILVELWTGDLKQGDYNKSRSDLLKRIKIIEKEDSDLSSLIKKCVHINPKRRPNIYELLDMFKELNEE